MYKYVHHDGDFALSDLVILPVQWSHKEQVECLKYTIIWTGWKFKP